MAAKLSMAAGQFAQRRCRAVDQHDLAGDRVGAKMPSFRTQSL